MMLWYSSPGVSYPTYRCRKAPGQGRASRRGHLTKLWAIEMLLDRGPGRSPQKIDIPHGVSNRPLEHLSDETLRLLVENAEQLEEGSGVVVDEDGQVITE